MLLTQRTFSNGRNYAAWIGLVPHQHSTGVKSRLLGISKRGNSDLRELFIHAARSILKRTETAKKHFGERVVNLKRTKPFNVVFVRTVWRTPHHRAETNGSL
ncbi:transposase [Photobacterium leiognathi]|uniref:transposase n=1 Tax=Photobacterium leiognathi TaxID=553611 RepID=UPI0034E957E8